MKKLLSCRKILQALYYLQSKAPADNPDRYNKVYLLKMIFMADRYHLRHFGYVATDDNYFAMKLGPVASITYDMLKKSLYDINSADAAYFFDAIRDLSENDVYIETQEEDELSPSFKEALDFALKEFGYYNWGKLSEITHYYPEWKKPAKAIFSGIGGSASMNIIDFFDDPEKDAYLSILGKDSDPFEEDKEFLTLMKEDFNANNISVQSA